MNTEQWAQAVREDAAGLESWLDPQPELRAAAEAPAVLRDVERFSICWGDVDATIRLHARLETTEHLAIPWNEWEHPRRIAWLRKHDRDLLATLAAGEQLELGA